MEQEDEDTVVATPSQEGVSSSQSSSSHGSFLQATSQQSDDVIPAIKKRTEQKQKAKQKAEALIKSSQESEESDVFGIHAAQKAERANKQRQKKTANKKKKDVVHPKASPEPAPREKKSGRHRWKLIHLVFTNDLSANDMQAFIRKKDFADKEVKNCVVNGRHFYITLRKGKHNISLIC